MARSINSPGVQIIETDLSQYQQIIGGTTVYVPGFAAQGPIDETLLITSISELEQVYGSPQSPAERYFYHTCKQVLNSPGTLLTSRLPYGANTGEGFAEQYSALLYPVLSTVDNSFKVYPPQYITLSEQEYEKILDGDFDWKQFITWDSGPALSGITTYEGLGTLYGYTSASLVSAVNYAVQTQVPTYSASPVPVGNYVLDTISTIKWVSQGNYQWLPETAAAAYNATWAIPASGTEYSLNAGLIVLNSSQTAANEELEGYYISVTDNSEWGPDTDFTAVSRFLALSSGNVGLSGVVFNVPSTRYRWALSGDKDVPGSNSISEQIERRYDVAIGDAYYNDSLVINLFKVRKSIYEPQELTISPVESHIGSFDEDKQALAANTGLRSFYLENVVNKGSNNLQVFVNPLISRLTNWASTSGVNIPAWKVRTAQNTKAIFPNSVYSPTYKTNVGKKVGNVRAKLERALVLVESPESVLIDVVVDAGISTIATNTQTGDLSSTSLSGGSYDDSLYYDTAPLIDPSSEAVTTYKSVINTFNNFCQNTRQDCVFVADPLRQIFVNGSNAKTLSKRSKTFSQDIYKPLKTIFETLNSNYSMTYANWVKVYDQFSDKNVWVPFSGFAAAAYARTDTFAQPWIAPAGLTRGALPNVLDLAFNPNQKQRDFLYTISQNPVVFFSGDGYVIFGQKTLQTKPSAFDRINVRRLFLTLERATGRALKYFVFEPNSEFTRTRLKNTISPIFELAKNTEGLYDYLIVCDERNNTSDVIDRNELAVDIYIKPVKAAEFILVNFIATRTGQNFQELL